MREEQFAHATNFILANLSEALTLADVASEVGLSPAYFHRRFRAFSGETLADFITRSRLTLAAQHLCLHEGNVLDVALRTGYRNHETFSRAFRRFHGLSPSQFRRSIAIKMQTDARRVNEATHQPAIVSRSFICRTRPVLIATLRHTGPYEDTPVTLWTELGDQLKAAGCSAQAFIGIAWDSPSAVPPHNLRFDAAATFVGQPVPSSNLTLSRLPARQWAASLHSGSYATIPEAYQQMVANLGREGIAIEPGPTLEFYHTDQMNSEREFNFTEIYLPVQGGMLA